jgi:hypothetical protein
VIADGRLPVIVTCVCRYEMAKGIHLTLDPFSPDLLTPTFKYKRNIIKGFFEKELARAYEESEEPEDIKDNFIKSKL